MSSTMSEFKDYFGRPARPRVRLGDEPGASSTACDDQFAPDPIGREAAIEAMVLEVQPHEWRQGGAMRYAGHTITWGEYAQQRKELIDEPWPEERMDVIGTNGNAGLAWDGSEMGNPWLSKHGHRLKESTSPTYRSWLAMKRRCSDSDNKNYGGKGISVCERWANSFESFLADMGERPEGCTIDRNNPDGDYEPSNCRWATSKEQAANRSSNTWIEIDGDLMLLTEVSARFSIPVSTLARRFAEGLTGRELIDPANRNRLRTGEKSPSAKLTEEKVREVKGLLSVGMQVKKIADDFNVSPTTIFDIKAGRTWRDVE